MFQNVPAIQQLQSIFQVLIAAGGAPIIVGGAVRDQLLGCTPKDVDIEVFGLEASVLENLLKNFGTVTRCGKSFGVLKLRQYQKNRFSEIDFSLPRSERKVADGHTGFEVTFDPHMTFADASFRRDFTINSMGWDVCTGTLLDPHEGQKDLEARVLRAVSPHFKEDPLRVLRGMRFAAQCELITFDPATLAMCQDLKAEFPTLSIERIWEEWYGWARKAQKPSLGMEFLRKTGWIEFFPEIQVLMGVPQDPIFHPEGDVYIHTCQCLDAMRIILDREDIQDSERRAQFMFTILGHDFAKPNTTAFHPVKRRWTAHDHCPQGVHPMSEFLNRIGAPERYINFCGPLIKEHLAYTNPLTSKNVAKLAVRLGDKATIHDLLIVIEADQSGRKPLPQFVLPPDAEKLREIASQEHVTLGQPKALIQGRHLVAAGYAPSPTFGPIIQRLYDLQLDQQFNSVEAGLLLVPEIYQTIVQSRRSTAGT